MCCQALESAFPHEYSHVVNPMNLEEQQFLSDLDKKRLWTAANKLLPIILDAVVYKLVVPGLIFFKYVSMRSKNVALSQFTPCILRGKSPFDWHGLRIACWTLVSTSRCKRFLFGGKSLVEESHLVRVEIVEYYTNQSLQMLFFILIQAHFIFDGGHGSISLSKNSYHTSVTDSIVLFYSKLTGY